MNGQINDRIKLEEETLRHRRKDSHVGRLGGEARSSPRTEARLRTHGVESPEARLRTHWVESPKARLRTHGHSMLTRMPRRLGRKRSLFNK